LALREDAIEGVKEFSHFMLALRQVPVCLCEVSHSEVQRLEPYINLHTPSSIYRDSSKVVGSRHLSLRLPFKIIPPKTHHPPTNAKSHVSAPVTIADAAPGASEVQESPTTERQMQKREKWWRGIVAAFPRFKKRHAQASITMASLKNLFYLTPKIHRQPRFQPPHETPGILLNKISCQSLFVYVALEIFPLKGPSCLHGTRRTLLKMDPRQNFLNLPSEFRRLW